MSDIQQSTGLNEAQAVEAAIGASSGALQLVGVDIRGGFSSSAARQQAIHAAESIAKNTNYTESFDKVLSASQGFSEANNDTKNSELGRSATSSLNLAKSLREEVSVAQNQVDTLSKDISSSQGKSLSVNKDLTQSVLEFIAHQPINSAPIGSQGGQIGYENARRIIENGGAERDAYLKRFQEANPQYKIETVNSSKEGSALSSKFESESAKVRESSTVASQYSQNTGTVLAQGKTTGLHPKNTPNSIKKEVTAFTEKNDDKRLEGRVGVDRHETDLKTAERTSKDKHLTGAMLKNAAVNIFDHSGEDKSLPVDQTPHNSPLNRK